MTRALIGFGVAVSLGTALGIAVSRFRIVKAAVGSLLTGLQTMPSIAWFPFAILLFGLTEQAILFVVVLGAAPSVANGLISGIGDVSPHLIRAARTMGARGVSLYRFIVLPAALPAYLSGLNQGWAFAWRSLMAGELLVIIASRPSLGVQLAYYRDFANAPALVASMIFILVIGMVVDGVFSRISNAARVRRGLGAVSR
ncbi:ABC transporter permease [Leifsonia sp. Root112D2]|uniref:ABC transporter permease n=1 Tax=Leifsonia sp. Root112D2 TaxID=1736426 RepID=UPI001F326DB9|nr:ABC transporter permease subunit [Leifsonia sp. Root112D2]